MKALTLTQPWATLVAREAKRWETRSWTTYHRGPLAIHAAKEYPTYARHLRTIEPFATELRDVGDLPLGVLLCVVELREVLRTEDAAVRFVIEGTPEESFGDWSHGRYAWRLGIVRSFAEPKEWRGAQGLWNLPDWVATLA